MNSFKYSFFPNTINDWNVLPSEIVRSTDILTATESVFRVLLFELVGVDDALLLSSDLLKDKPVFLFPSLLLYV